MPGRMRIYCMTDRLHAWLRQAHSDLAMAAYANQGGFHAQACYHCSQAGGSPLFLEITCANDGGTPQPGIWLTLVRRFSLPVPWTLSSPSPPRGSW
jgi:hypothetical protein